jgi:hypothetical protein
MKREQAALLLYVLEAKPSVPAEAAVFVSAMNWYIPSAMK